MLQFPRWVNRTVPILLAVSLSLFATADGPDCWDVTGVDSSDVLNIREEPTYKSDIVGTVPHDGVGLKNLETTGGLTFQEFTTLSEEERDSLLRVRPRWQKVQYDSIVGWVNGKFVMEGSCEEEK